ncbi:MAG: hypothetical protein WAW88_10780 [Nocardioides sp.]
MNSTTAIALHGDVLQQDLHETVHQLNVGLGPTLVSLLAGANDQKVSIRWARADGPLPRSHETRARLLDAHRAWTMLVTHYNEYTARNWFIAANPRLGEDAPVERLRAGDSKAVLKAAQAFIDGTFQ